MELELHNPKITVSFPMRRELKNVLGKIVLDKFLRAGMEGLANVGRRNR